MVRGGAELSALVLGVITTLWVSRAVGPSYFGQYAVMMTVVTLGGLLINAGLTTAGAQRVANTPSARAEVIWVVTVIRIVLAAVAVLVAFLVLALAPVDPVLAGLLRTGLLVWLLTPLTYGWVLIAQGRLSVISSLRVTSAVATLVSALILVGDVSDAARLGWIPVAGAFVNALGTSIVMYRGSPARRPTSASLAKTIRSYLGAGGHCLKADLSSFVFTTSDRLFLYVFAPPAVVGLYAAAYSVIQPFYMINAVIWDAMYLPLARALRTERLRPLFRRYVDLMAFATIPLGFFLTWFAPTVIAILYGAQYEGAAEYLGILGWVITFGYTSGIAVLPFSAWNQAREYGNATALGGSLNLVLNIALIPPFQGLGAAWATVAAKIAVTIAGLWYFRRATDYPLVRDFVEYFAVSGASLAAAVVTTLVLPFGSGVGIVVFGVVYVLLVATLRWRSYLLPAARVA